MWDISDRSRYIEYIVFMFADDWDDKGEDSASTPDPDDGGGGGGAVAPKQPQKSRKIVVQDDSGAEKCPREKRKDHLNILFIGHVGQYKNQDNPINLFMSVRIKNKKMQRPLDRTCMSVYRAPD